MNEVISYVEKIKEINHSSATALMIIKDDQVILEHYSGYHSNSNGSEPISKSSQFNVASARKSYLGLAVAYALFERRIMSLDDYAIDYLDGFDQDLLNGITIRHLVTHTHGLNEKDGLILREFEPGQGWAYRNINIKLITELLHQLYGRSFTEVLNEKVFQPIGFNETGWYTKPHKNLVKVINDPSDIGSYKLGKSNDGTESNLYVSTREFALWGYLHLNNGFMNGRQIVPKEVIQLAIQVQSPPKIYPQNGLFWYVQDQPNVRSEIGERVPKGSYQILGVSGPTLLIIPKYNLVVAKMYNKRYNYGGNYYLHYLREFSNLVADTFNS